MPRSSTGMEILVLRTMEDRKSTLLNSSHSSISYAVFCLKKKTYVPIYGDSGIGKQETDGRNVVVIDIGARKVIGNIDFGHGVRPHCAVFGPKDDMLYVTT